MHIWAIRPCFCFAKQIVLRVSFFEWFLNVKLKRSTKAVLIVLLTGDDVIIRATSSWYPKIVNYLVTQPDFVTEAKLSIKKGLEINLTPWNHYGTPGRIRTCYLRIRSLRFYMDVGLLQFTLLSVIMVYLLIMLLVGISIFDFPYTLRPPNARHTR